MEQVTLQFPTPQGLVAFRQLLGNAKYQISIVDLTIVCMCTKKEMELAVNTYGAKVIQKAQQQ